MDFTGKCVLVTGGSRGIGKAVATGFAKRGARVAISFFTNGNAARATVKDLPGGQHLFYQTDVGDPDDVKYLVDRASEELGGLDILVNNVGIHMEHRLEDVDYDKWQTVWRDILGVNLQGTANMMYCAAKYMIKHGGGRIVNVSSRGAFRGEPDHPAYGASKAGVNSMSQSLAQRLAPHNIFIGVVAPGYVQTDLVSEKLAGPEGDAIRAQSPLDRVARPEEVAYAVMFLAAEESKFCTGAIIDVNGASYLRT
ncbi:MAG: SDR family oxidoreductase [Candidatus Latescibacterota bacterium]|nr:MAG: SDR family oxidoreductase [Candidatus Latescibacterota bacterium]